MAVPSTLYASTANTGAFAVAPTTLVAALHGALGGRTRTELKLIDNLLKRPELQKTQLISQYAVALPDDGMVAGVATGPEQAEIDTLKLRRA